MFDDRQWSDHADGQPGFTAAWHGRFCCTAHVFNCDGVFAGSVFWVCGEWIDALHCTAEPEGLARGYVVESLGG